MAAEIEVHKPGEGEAEECTGEDEPEDEIVGLAEAEGVVHLAGPGIETVLRGACRCNHCDRWE